MDMNMTQNEFWKEFQQIESIIDGYEYRKSRYDGKYYWFCQNKEIKKYKKFLIKKCFICGNLFLGNISKDRQSIVCSNGCRGKYVAKYTNAHEKIQKILRENYYNNPILMKKKSDKMKDIQRNKIWNYDCLEYDEFRKKHLKYLKSFWDKDNDKYKNARKVLSKKVSKMVRKFWKDDKYEDARDKRLNNLKKLFNNPEFKKCHNDNFKKNTSSPISKEKIKLGNKIVNIIRHRLLNENFHNLFIEYKSIIQHRDKTDNQKNRMNYLWDKMYRKNPQMKSLITMEVKNELEKQYRPLNSGDLEKVKNFFKKENEK